VSGNGGAARSLHRRYASVAACLTLLAAPCLAQTDSASLATGPSRRAYYRYAWAGAAVALGVTAVADRRLDAFALSHHTRTLDDAAHVADPFGRAGILVPALAVSVIAPRVVGRRKLSDAMPRVALGYAAADGVESVLKPLVGRHRPTDGGSQWRFHAFRNDEQWHSFPSAHTVHAFGIATGLAMEARTRWVAVPAYGVATVVGLQRVYTGAHWGSDVIGSAALAVVVAGATDRMLRRGGLRWVLRPEVTPWSLGVQWTF
jgi:membrane-associated phospholipid phosphatase